MKCRTIVNMNGKIRLNMLVNCEVITAVITSVHRHTVLTIVDYGKLLKSSANSITGG